MREQLKKTPYRQEINGACMVYCMANLFQDERFFEERDYSKGMTNFSLNKVLESLGYKMFLNDDLCMPDIKDEYLMLYHRDNIVDEGYLVPCVLTVPSVNGDFDHAVLGLIGDEEMYIIDSNKEKILWGTILEAREEYKVIKKIAFLWDMNHSTIAIGVKNLAHLI